MKCKNCGTEFLEGIFCPECGTKNEDVIIDEKAIRTAQEGTEKNVYYENDYIKNKTSNCICEEVFHKANQEEEQRIQNAESMRLEKEKKINRKAILSLVLGIVSWLGLITVIISIICGIWSIIDGIKALKEKTKYKKCAVIGIILSTLILLILIFIICIVLQSSPSDESIQVSNPSALSDTGYEETVDDWKDKEKPLEIETEETEFNLADNQIEETENVLEEPEDEYNYLELEENEDANEYGVMEFAEALDISDSSNSEVYITSNTIEAMDSLEDFPYYNSKAAVKLLKLYKKALKADDSEFVYVEYTSKGIFDTSKQYKQTLSPTDYRYYGDMKDGLPDGQGIVVTKYSQSNLYDSFLPKVLGNFKDGQLDGYAINFTNDVLFYVLNEGNYEKGIKQGDYVEYASSILAIIASSDEITKEEYEMVERYLYDEEYASDVHGKIILDVPVTPTYISAVGKYKDDKIIGNCTIYFPDGTIASKIKMNNNGSTGKATIYYKDGTVKYDGEIKDGNYHGKGILYREDGSVEYKGKFKDGKIAN